MRASLAIKPTTDAYGAIAVSNLYAIALPQVHVANPTADADPNTAGLLPTDPRVIAPPNFALRFSPTLAASILGGTSLVGRVWNYDTASGKWVATGNLLTQTPGATTSATVIATIARTKKAYFQVTAVVGAVTDLTYGFTQ